MIWLLVITFPALIWIVLVVVLWAIEDHAAHLSVRLFSAIYLCFSLTILCGALFSVVLRHTVAFPAGVWP